MTQKEEFLTSIKLHQTFLYHARGTRAMHFFYALKMESLPEILLSLDTEILLVLTFQYSSLAGDSKQTLKLGHETLER